MQARACLAVICVASLTAFACEFGDSRDTDAGASNSNSGIDLSASGSSESIGGSIGGSSGANTSGANTSGASTSGDGEVKFDLGAGVDAPPQDTGEEECGSILHGTLRDFRQSHPDFEYTIQVDPGIVASALGGDEKPVYAGDPSTPTTHGQQEFDQWYRDVPGVNIALPVEIPLTLQNGLFTYDNPAFFPIDGQGHGDEGNIHNYHFTLEIATEFTYHGGEVFTFTGDDDLFTFINGQLAIDLGGVHGPLTGSVNLDEQAAALGITPGGTYSLHFFFAERHTSESNFRIDTTISCFAPPPE